MKLRHILTAAAATFALATSSAAFARDYDHDRNHGHQSSHSDRNDHRDRDWNHGNRGYHMGYTRHDYRPYVGHDRVRIVLRSHNYRYVSDPYWYRGQYVVRAYDPYGRIVLVRVDPYSGAWMGISIRL